MGTRGGGLVEWSPRIFRTIPAPGEVHIWDADLGDIPEATSAEALTGPELERHGRFARAEDAHRFAAGRALLRLALSGYVDCAPHEVRFTHDAGGKPTLAEPRGGVPLEFNLAHAGRCLAVAVARRRVGVDVERVRSMGDYDAVARTCFTEEERALLRSVDAAQRADLFFRIWTRKEAFTKAVGTGLSMAAPSTTPAFPEGWSGAELDCPAAYAAAVAIEGALTAVHYVHPFAPGSARPGVVERNALDLFSAV